MRRTKLGAGANYEQFMQDRHHKNVMSKLLKDKRELEMIKHTITDTKESSPKVRKGDKKNLRNTVDLTMGDNRNIQNQSAMVSYDDT